MRRALTGAILALLALALPASAAQPIAWEQWLHVQGVADIGLRSDGNLVVMANARLYLVSPASGAVTALGSGADAFVGGGAVDAEYYFAVAPAQPVDGAGCSFDADDVFILDLVSPPAVVRVDATGRAARFATLNGVDTAGGIVVDTVGLFGHRLLVTGTRDNKATLFAVDCQGNVQVITSSAPPVEGGIAVAPVGFGGFGGQLIAPDENSGQVWAIDQAGTATLVAVPNLPTGGDTGAESIGFIPPGFMSGGGVAYLADRGTPNNPFPGNDAVLRLSSAALASAGVQDGDLLVSTEGGGTTVAIRCADGGCSVLSAAQGTPGGHIEGHVVTILAQAAP